MGMHNPRDEGLFQAEVVRLLEGEHIDPSYLVFVLRHLHEPDANWRWCCGSHCDPCVEGLGRVVDAARRFGRISVEGLPNPDGPT